MSDYAYFPQILAWVRRADSDFARMVQGLTPQGFSRAQMVGLPQFRDKASDELGHFLTEQLKLEKQLAVRVEDAYGLTPEERQPLRATCPVRDLTEALEARLGVLDCGFSKEHPQDE